MKGLLDTLKAKEENVNMQYTKFISKKEGLASIIDRMNKLIEKLKKIEKLEKERKEKNLELQLIESKDGKSYNKNF